MARNGVRREDLDDLAQETFETVHRQLPSFENKARFETWLYAVTWRVASSHRRRIARRGEVPHAHTDDFAAAAALSCDAAQQQRTLAAMEDELRDVLTLRDVGELSISQVSALTGRARATVRTRLAQGRSALQRRSSPPEAIDAATLQQPPSAPRRAHQVETDDATIATLGDLVIARWCGPSSPRAVEALTEVMLAAALEHPAGIRYLSVVEACCAPPDRQTRKELIQCARALGSKLRATAWAVEDLQQMALFAAVMNACLIAGGVPVDQRFFTAVPAAARWIARDEAEARSIAVQLELLRGPTR